MDGKKGEPMFLKATCDNEPCLVNTDYVMEVYDLDNKEVRAYTIDNKYPYYIPRSEWEKFMAEQSQINTAENTNEIQSKPTATKSTEVPWWTKGE